MTNNVVKYWGAITKLPVFAGISDAELQKILKNSQINSYQKDQFLFSAEQKIINFYIVLEGVVKLFVDSLEGVETIIQIINSKNYINDIFSNRICANAQALKDSIILTIPLTDVQEYTQKNLNFAVNILHSITTKNQELAHHLARLKLSDAEHKLGQFLLKTASEKGAKKNSINLELSKSEIASYLGMRPETLSRTIAKLKDQINVKGNVVTLKNEHSLCGYCDSEIAGQCQNFEPESLHHQSCKHSKS